MSENPAPPPDSIAPPHSVSPPHSVNTPRRTPHGLADFDLVQELGSGTTGTVYLATLRRAIKGLAAGEKVAVKFLHQHLLDDAGARSRFLREAKVGFFAKSQNLVRVYAVEETQLLGAPVLFIIMEFIDGTHLRELLKEGALAEPLVRSIGEQVARGIADLHNSGIVHLDIKPENVVLAPGGRAVVMDLGFSRPLAPSTESEKREFSTFAGSVAYAAPERLRGLPPSPQSDIYSVGVLLYELITGERPFPSEDPTAVIRGHLENPPPVPSSKNPRISPFLESVIFKCLEKDYLQRFASAEELAQVINKSESSQFWQEKIAERARIGVPGAKRVHLTPFVDRDAELRELATAYARAAAGAFRIVHLYGDPGIGKTRIIDEFVTMTQESDDPPVSLYGRCRKSDELQPARAFVTMLLRYLNVPNDTVPDANAARRVRALLPAAAANLIIDFLKGRREQVELQKLFRAIADFIEAIAREHPIIAFLDGADECDAATAEIAAAIVERAPARVCFVVGHRPNASRMDNIIETGRSKKLVTSIQLLPFAPGDIAEIIDRLIEPGEDRLLLRETLVRATGGNPGHLSETLRTLKASGALVAAGAAGGGQLLKIAKPIRNIPIPESLGEAIRTRFNALDTHERQALGLVAVAGDRCDPELLVSAFGGDALTWLRTLSRLETQHSLLTSSADTFRFARPIVREVIYESLDINERRRSHGAFALALEKRLGTHPSDRDRRRVAEHARRSTNIGLALRHLPALAEDFRRRGHFERALVLARSSIELLNRLPRKQKALLEARFDALVTIAECASRLGQRILEKRTLEKCARIATYLADTARLARTLLSLGRLCYATGRYLVSASYLDRAIDLASNAGDVRTESEAALAKSIVVSYSGDVEKAGPLLDHALELATDSDLRARVLLQQALRSLNLDRPDLALPQIEEAARAFKELRMPAAQAAAFFHRARCHADIGKFTVARRDLDRALTLAREAGERRTEAMTLSLRGAIRAAARDYESAEKDLRAAIALADEINDRFTECHTALHLANSLLSSKNPKQNLRESTRLARLALTLAEELGLPRLRAFAHSVRARALLRSARKADALTESQRALSVLSEGPRDRRRAAGVLFTHALILKESGRAAEAQSYFNDAASIINDAAARITDEKIRNAFLNDEPFHRKVVGQVRGQV
ncbi:MAG: serine/threonine-protein kinase PknK [Planctomycetota bacterium]